MATTTTSEENGDFCATVSPVTRTADMMCELRYFYLMPECVKTAR